ncbi:hypothetical protein ABPG75_013422 [Micractinium tetrahymenae]
MQRYVPPSRRRGLSEGDAAAAAELRGLEGASAAISQVRLVLLREGVAFDPASCPLDMEAERAAGGGSGDPAAQASGSSPGGSADGSMPLPASFLIFFPERLPTELLRWLGDTFPDGAARLEFPASLSKAERARWHQSAERLRLHGQSVGVGDDRFLTIGTAPPDSGSGGEPAGSRGGRPQLSREQRDRARFIWNVCQMEGGKHWERSQGEVEAMVASGQPLPADLQELVDRRLRGEEVHRLLKSGRPSEALSLLSEEPKLAWVMDTETGGYPVHQAAWKGYESVVLFLASLPGVLEQRDGRRETALALARRRRHSTIEELLLEAGAKPEHASFGGAPDGSPEGGEGADDDYCSWSAEERWRYRHGGQGGRAPPGLQRGGGRFGARGGGRGGGRGVSGGRGWSRSGVEPAGSGGGPQGGDHPHQPQQQSRCPW